MFRPDTHLGCSTVRCLEPPSLRTWPSSPLDRFALTIAVERLSPSPAVNPVTSLRRHNVTEPDDCHHGHRRRSRYAAQVELM